MTTFYSLHGCGQNADTFKSLLKPLINKTKNDKWIHLQGKYPEGNGWAWFSYNKYFELEEDKKQDDIEQIIDKIKDNAENTILIGFSEGARFALEIAQHITLKQIIAISPSYEKTEGESINTPTVLIYSRNESKIIKRSCKKWLKYLNNVIEIFHDKGHKVYLPSETIKIILNKLI